MVAIILQRLCQAEALKDFKISDLLPPIFSEVYFEYLVMCRRGHEQIHEFFSELSAHKTVNDKVD